MDKLHPLVTGFTLALTVAVMYALCAAAFALWPQPTLDFFNAWFHGMDLTAPQSGVKPFTLGLFLYGFAGLTASGFVTGVVYALTHNLIRPCIGGNK
ncbi:MAG: DUF5676 family membrane protein [Gammaproteobacteria bacterium]